jgi:hypothetical protein
VTFEVSIYNTAGNLVAPTLLQPITETLAPRDNYTLYSHDLAELPVGFQGSVVIRVTGGEGLLSAVSNNVNYAVQNDGSAAFNLVNFDLPVEPEAPAELALVLAPETSDNPFYADDDLIAEIAQAIIDADTQFWAGDTASDVFFDILAEGFDEEGNLDLDTYLASYEGLEITQGDLNAIAAAWLSVNQHTVTATFYVDGEVVTDDDDLEVEFVVAGANNFTEVVDLEDGVATLTYNATQAGQDTINASITIGDDDDEVVVEAAPVTKTWTPTDSEVVILD